VVALFGVGRHRGKMTTTAKTPAGKCRGAKQRKNVCLGRGEKRRGCSPQHPAGETYRKASADDQAVVEGVLLAGQTRAMVIGWIVLAGGTKTREKTSGGRAVVKNTIVSKASSGGRQGECRIWSAFRAPWDGFDRKSLNQVRINSDRQGRPPWPKVEQWCAPLA